MTPGQVRARNARRTIALVAAAGGGLAAGCGDAAGPLRPADVVGTYTLQTSRGHALPWADTSAADPNASQWIVYGEART